MLVGLRPLLERLRRERDRLTDEEARDALADAAPTNGGGDPGKQVGESFLEVRRLLGALEQAGILLRDIDRGLLDFPSIQDGREVYLCWELADDEVAHWHELDSGYVDRKPLE